MQQKCPNIKCVSSHTAINNDPSKELKRHAPTDEDTQRDGAQNGSLNSCSSGVAFVAFFLFFKHEFNACHSTHDHSFSP